MKRHIHRPYLIGMDIFLKEEEKNETAETKNRHSCLVLYTYMLLLFKSVVWKSRTVSMYDAMNAAIFCLADSIIYISFINGKVSMYGKKLKYKISAVSNFFIDWSHFIASLFLLFIAKKCTSMAAPWWAEI